MCETKKQSTRMDLDPEPGPFADNHSCVVDRNFPEPIRANLGVQLAMGGDKFHFAWFGPPDPTKPHAFRLQGPTLFIDLNDKQDHASPIRNSNEGGTCDGRVWEQERAGEIWASR